MASCARTGASSRRARRWRSTRPSRNRLGISSIKWELEDLSFFYLEPAKYQPDHAAWSPRAATSARRYLEQVIGITARRARPRRASRTPQIMGRPKHLYSIYQKMTKKGKDFSEIYDLIAVRVIVDDGARLLLGCWAPSTRCGTPCRDASKTTSPCRSSTCTRRLHTTVIGPAGRPLEVQIRTEEMHRTERVRRGRALALQGEGLARAATPALDQQLAWLRQMAGLAGRDAGLARVPEGPEGRPVRRPRCSCSRRRARP